MGTRFRLFWGLVAMSATASASVVTVPRSAFPGSSLLLDFSSLPSGTDLNDITIDGASFSYTINGIPERDVVQIAVGPGVTTNLPSSPSAVSNGDNTGVVAITLGRKATLFGYGYALLSFNTTADATTISLFNGTTLIDSINFAAHPDPLFAGGFAGIESTVSFDHVELSFNANAAPAFAFNNLVLASTPAQVPEPGAGFLVFIGATLMLALRNTSYSSSATKH